jgi:hypothetical protein
MRQREVGGREVDGSEGGRAVGRSCQKKMGSGVAPKQKKKKKKQNEPLTWKPRSPFLQFCVL